MIWPDSVYYCANNIGGGGFKLVRRIPPGLTWHPAKFALTFFSNENTQTLLWLQWPFGRDWCVRLLCGQPCCIQSGVLGWFLWLGLVEQNYACEWTWRHFRCVHVHRCRARHGQTELASWCATHPDSMRRGPVFVEIDFRIILKLHHFLLLVVWNFSKVLARPRCLLGRRVTSLGWLRPVSTAVCCMVSSFHTRAFFPNSFNVMNGPQNAYKNWILKRDDIISASCYTFTYNSQSEMALRASTRWRGPSSMAWTSTSTTRTRAVCSYDDESTYVLDQHWILLSWSMSSFSVAAFCRINCVYGSCSSNQDTCTCHPGYGGVSCDTGLQ